MVVSVGRGRGTERERRGFEKILAKNLRGSIFSG